MLACPLCEHEIEDEWHVLFYCEVSVLARQVAGIDHVLTSRLQQSTNISQVILQLCTGSDMETSGVFAMLAWILWQNRNNRIWNESQEPGRTLGVTARQLWEGWKSVQQVQTGSIGVTQQQQQIEWHTSPNGWFKCNVDATFHKDINKTSVGWCLRDHTGRFVLAGAIWKEGNCSITEGESMALLEALQAMEQRSISRVIYETDSKNVADAVHHSKGGRSEYSTIITLIRNVLRNNPNFMVKFIKRQANMD